MLIVPQCKGLSVSRTEHHSLLVVQSSGSWPRGTSETETETERERKREEASFGGKRK